MGGHIFGRAIFWEGMGGHPCINKILSEKSSVILESGCINVKHRIIVVTTPSIIKQSSAVHMILSVQSRAVQ